MHARNLKNTQNSQKMQFWVFLRLCACTYICAQPQCYAYQWKGYYMYFSATQFFFAVHTSIVLTTRVLGTPKLGLACTAPCTLQCALKWVMLGIIGKLLPCPNQKCTIKSTFMHR